LNEIDAPPFQVPRRIPRFVGRESAIATLRSALKPGKLAVICGDESVAGIGRSALAIHFASVFHRLFPDGVLYARPAERDATTILASFATAYGEDITTASDPSSWAHVASAALAKQQVLIVLDDVEQEESVRHVLAGCGEGCAVLVTAADESLAEALVEETEAIVRVGALSEEESLALLGGVVGEEKTRTEEESSRAIGQLLGGNPLALEIAGRLARSRDWGMGQLVTWLREDQQWMQALRVPNLPVRTAVELSHKLLNEQDKALYAALGAFRGSSFDAAAARAVLGTDDATEGLGALCDLALLWRRIDGRFRQHSLLAELALEKLRGIGHELAVFRRHAYHFATLAELASEKLQRPETAAAARRAFEEDRPQMRLGQTWALRVGEDKAAVAYAFTLGTYLNLAGLDEEAVEGLNTGIQAARRQGRRDWEGDLLGKLGYAYAGMGDYSNAQWNYQQALSIHREIGDLQGAGTDLGNLGKAHAELGDTQQAIACHQDALEISREIGDRPGEAADLANLGSAFHQIGEMQKAAGHFEQARRIAKEIGNRRGELNYSVGLGLAYLGMDNPQTAIGYLDQALAIAQEIGQRRGEEQCWENLGRAYARLGASKTAECFQRALAIARERGDRKKERDHLDNLGRFREHSRQWHEAIENYKAALVISRGLGDHRTERACLNSLGNACLQLDDKAQARQYFEQALAVARNSGDLQSQGVDLGNLGLVYAGSGAMREAIRCYQQAIGIAREMGEWLMEGNHLGNLGNAYADTGRFEMAIECYEQALAVYGEVGNRVGEGTALGNLGLVYASLGETHKAQSRLQAALDVAEEIEDDVLAATFSWDLGLLLVEQGRREEGFALMERSVEARETFQPGDAAADRHRLQALRRQGRFPGWISRLLPWLRHDSL
jgi:tetratricopeptide (TPR) repeat protein